MSTVETSIPERTELVRRALALPAGRRTPAEVARLAGPALSAECPHLVAMLSSPDADVAGLARLACEAECVQRGVRTEHEASVRVGKELVDRYVRPAVSREP